MRQSWRFFCAEICIEIGQKMGVLRKKLHDFRYVAFILGFYGSK